MFYAHFVLAKRGPLAKIWLAAHWDKKLTKSHVFETNIEHSVEGILQPKVKMALRTSGHLLLGIVRIYSRKAKYLLADCNEAFIKIKMAFRPGVVDLPENNREAAVATITLPEVFHDFDTTIPDITIDMDASVNLNQSRAEDITLKEDYGSLQLMADDAFDMAFDEPEAARDATNIDDGFEHASLLLCEEAKERSEETITPVLHTSNNSGSKANVSIDPSLKNDGFGGCLLDETGSLFEPAGLFDDAPLDHVSLENAEENMESSNTNEKQPQDKRHEEDSDDDDMYDMGPGSMGVPSPASSAASVHESNGAEIFGSEPNGRLDMGEEPFLPVSGEKSAASATDMSVLNDSGATSALPFDHHKLMNEEESFALGPLDASIVEGNERIVKSKRKRKLIVDEVKNISGEEMKLQLSDTADIVVTLDLAPPTKRLMHFKETGGVEKLFSLPGHIILSKTLSKAYQMHLTTRSVENEMFGFDEDLIDLDADLGEATKERERDGETEIASVSRKRRLDEDPMLPPGENLTPHLDAFSHPSFEVTNFLQSHQHMFPPNAAQQIPEQQMMPNVMSVMSHPPQAHMIQQMLQPDVNQLSHIPQIMHPSMVDQGPPLHAINPSIHNPSHPLPGVVPEAYNQGIQSTSYGTCSPPQHLLAETIPQIADHLHHSDIDKQMPNRPPLDERLNESNLQNQQTQPADQMPCTENTLTCVSNAQQTTIQLHENSVDDDLTQPCLGEDFPGIMANMGENKISNVTPLSGSLSSETILHNETSNAPIKDINVCGEQGDGEGGETCENVNLVPVGGEARQECNSSDLLFDSLNNNGPQIDSHTQNRIQDHDDEQQQKNDPFPLSDDDDYGAPPSVGPALPEEQMADETYEQFEERILVKRTTHLLHFIHGLFDDRGSLKFGALMKGSKRKSVAQKFYTFLVLKKLEAVELEHDEKGELIITRGLKYNTVYNGN